MPRVRMFVKIGLLPYNFSGWISIGHLIFSSCGSHYDASYTGWRGMPACRHTQEMCIWSNDAHACWNAIEAVVIGGMPYSTEE